jgi:integrase/recombinase XerD
VERGLSANTLAAYRRDLGRYLDFLDAEGISDLGAVTEATITSYQARLREGDQDHPALSATSVARMVVAVRGFHKFAFADGLSPADPAAAVRPMRPAKRLPKALPLSDVEAILGAVETETHLGLRDKALLEVLYGTGARISEAVGLDIDDIDLVGGADGVGSVTGAVLLRGKGGKQRLVPLGSYARAALEAWPVRVPPSSSTPVEAGSRVSRPGRCSPAPPSAPG